MGRVSWPCRRGYWVSLSHRKQRGRRREPSRRTQSEERPSSQRPDVADEEDEDDALEMEEDFEGDLMDPCGAEGNEDEAESDRDSGPDLDEKIQDIDENDANAVDEKFWGGEQGPEDSTFGEGSGP